MLRNSATVLLVCALFVGGCKKNNEEASATGAGETPAAADKAAEGAAAPAIAWENVERVPFSDLQGLLPETVLGMKRTDLAGKTEPGEYMHTEASAEYEPEGDDERRLTLVLQDYPTYARDSLSSKTSSFKGYPIVREAESSGYGEINFVVGDRFFVVARGPMMKVADLKSAFEKVDLAKLASWKDQGIKK